MYEIGTSAANDINQSGQVAGAAAYASLWTPTTPNGTTGSFQSLGMLPAFTPVIPLCTSIHTASPRV